MQPAAPPNLTFGKFPLGKLNIREVATWEVAFGKIKYTSSIEKIKNRSKVETHVQWISRSMLDHDLLLVCR